jgi:hypothetical protein
MSLVLVTTSSPDARRTATSETTASGCTVVLTSVGAMGIRRGWGGGGRGHHTDGPVFGQNDRRGGIRVTSDPYFRIIGPSSPPPNRPYRIPVSWIPRVKKRCDARKATRTGTRALTAAAI